MMTSGRKLKILEHRVHKVEMRQKENDESEEELVVSNLRPFLLKVGVHDHMDNPILDCSLPLRASLLYENGLPVKQTSSSEPLVVGETDVVALQGAATFKLRITSLSSHRDKQRFRIQARAIWAAALLSSCHIHIHSCCQVLPRRGSSALRAAAIQHACAWCRWLRKTWRCCSWSRRCVLYQIR